MSVDKSLKLQSGLQRVRSVLSRSERLAELLEVGKWKEGESIFGLPKVRVRKLKRKAKAAKAEAAAPGAAPAAVPTAGAAKPGAAAAKPAAAKPGAAPAAGKAAPKK